MICLRLKSTPWIDEESSISDVVRKRRFSFDTCTIRKLLFDEAKINSYEISVLREEYLD